MGGRAQPKPGSASAGMAGPAFHPPHPLVAGPLRSSLKKSSGSLKRSVLGEKEAKKMEDED